MEVPVVGAVNDPSSGFRPADGFKVLFTGPTCVQPSAGLVLAASAKSLEEVVPAEALATLDSSNSSLVYQQLIV